MTDDTLITRLQDPDDKKAYALMQEIVETSAFTSRYYEYIDDFASLLGSEKTYIRTRAFLICCALARWDDEHRIQGFLPDMLKLFHDKKAIVVRQCLAAAKDLVEYRPELRASIEEEARSIDLTQYRESMIPLLQKDIDKLLYVCSLYVITADRQF